MTIYLLNFAGTALGAILCPLFLRNKWGIGFIVLITLPQIVVRSLGVAKTPSPSIEETFRTRGLTRREIEVAALLVQEGLGAGEIGDRLYISERTVNDHIASIYRKFAVRKRGEFMAMFVGK
jgi:DNA-binding CsgD family transcriptional regulator